jgi:hypothetical protein
MQPYHAECDDQRAAQGKSEKLTEEEMDRTLAEVQRGEFDLFRSLIIRGCDKEFVSSAVQLHEEALAYVSAEFLQDSDIVLSALTHHGKALRYAPLFASDKNIVLAAVMQNSGAFAFVNPKLTKDKDFVMSAVRSDAHALQYADDELKDDMEIALTALEQDVGAVQYLSTTLQGSKTIILFCLQKLASTYVSFDCVDPDIVISSRVNRRNPSQHRHYQRCSCDQEERQLRIPKSLLNSDRDVVKALLTLSWKGIEFVSDVFKDDLEVVLSACKENCEAFKSASQRLKSDPNSAKEALRIDAKCFQFLSHELRRNKSFILRALEALADPTIINYIPGELLSELSFRREVAQSCPSYVWNPFAKFASKSIEENVQEEAVPHHGS